MESRRKAVILQAVAALILILSLIALELIGDQQIWFVFFMIVAFSAIPLFLLGFILERKAKNTGNL